MEKDPPPLCYARPREDNILEWHFILRGPPGTPYEGGEYWGQLLFPGDYPFKPPGIKVQTPSGRFQPDTRICTSMSDFHPGSWNPAWSVSSILIGLLSFMCTDELTTGSVLVSARERRLLAAQSHAYNLRQRRFTQLFPEYTGPVAKDLPNMSRPAAAPAAPAPAATKAPEKRASAPASDAPSASPAPEPAQNAKSKWRILFWVTCSVAGVLFANKVLEKLAM